jgi:hypothetical protein
MPPMVRRGDPRVPLAITRVFTIQHLIGANLA